MRARMWIAVCAASVLAPQFADAQRAGGNGRRQQQGMPPQEGVPPEQRLGQIMKTQLHLTDAQAQKLQETNRRYGERRRAMNDEEGQARMTMRDGLCSGDSARSPEVAHAIDQLIDIQKRRVQMVDDEQHELTSFLTPFQRARYLGFNERVIDALGGRGGRGGRMGPPPGNDAPPPNADRPAGRAGGPPDMCAAPPPDGMQRGLRGRGRG